MYKITTAPTVEPLTATEVKNYLKVDHTDDDDLIAIMITAAREYVERYTNRALMTQTIVEYRDDFPKVTTTNPRGGIEFRFAPVQSLTHLKYYDSDGNEQTYVSGTNYTFDNISEPPRIFPYYETTFATVRDIPNAVWFEYIAGYTQASDVPAAIKQAMMLIIAKMYEQREDTIKNLPSHSQWLLNQYKIPHIL